MWMQQFVVTSWTSIPVILNPQLLWIITLGDLHPMPEGSVVGWRKHSAGIVKILVDSIKQFKKTILPEWTRFSWMVDYTIVVGLSLLVYDPSVPSSLGLVSFEHQRQFNNMRWSHTYFSHDSAAGLGGPRCGLDDGSLTVQLGVV